MVADNNRAFGWNIEQHFHEWLLENNNDAEVAVRYLPVYWWNNSAALYRSKVHCGFYAVPGVQQFVDQLDASARYVTVSRGADGIYERIPYGVIVCSAGGGGDIPIPHLCEIERRMAHSSDRKWLASFVGNLNPGGPEVPRPIGRSSANPNGVGTRVRQKMASVFNSEPDCTIIPAQMMSWSEEQQKQHTIFCDVASDSWFGLAPRGYGKTSYRLYEMFALGTIPVYIYDEPWLPYLDKLDWREFAVLCHESELDALPELLRQIPIEKRLAMIARGTALYGPYFTQDGMCRRIMEYVSQL